ncbi:hypothetical protein C1646_671198 [Rhizophagus diaphanus]|nr:hypothetical protein C1646_671198 [Rhizophagus diaphanus] [Rhizophagus sp. MUCL 43196]
MRATNSYHKRPWFSDVSVHMNSEKLFEYISDKSICYGQLRENTREFMFSEHPDFLKKFKKNQWQIYYEKNIAQLSIWGMLIARIKDAIFLVFSEFPPINMSTKESEIKKWKGIVSVKRCYDKLFQKEKKNAPKMQVVYMISICETILNPENTIVQINEEIIKQIIIKHYQKIVKKDNFLYSDEYETGSSLQEEANETMKRKIRNV